MTGRYKEAWYRFTVAVNINPGIGMFFKFSSLSGRLSFIVPVSIEGVPCQGNSRVDTAPVYLHR